MSECKDCERHEYEIECLRREVGRLERRVQDRDEEIENLADCDFCDLEADRDRREQEATRAQKVVWELHNADTICLCEVCSEYRHE